MARLRIVGSGPVALAFALFATRQGFTPADIDLDLDDSPAPAALAQRVLAISLGSWQLLSRVARPPQSAPIGAVDVWVQGHAGRTRITARESDAPALGYVLRYGALLEALRGAAQAQGLGRAPDTGAAPAVVVHAEGDTGADAAVLEFEQAALLAEVSVADEHGSIAFECFTAHGPLALLPLPEPRRYSLVWCATPAESARRAALEPSALAAELLAEFGWALGAIRIEGTPLVWPMARRARRRLVEGNEVWVGNAAQALHPVAGQGLNLGIRDAFLLAHVLGEAVAGRRNLELALETYLKRRRLDRGGTIALTDALARLFSLAPLRPLQSIAIAGLDAAPAVRHGLARQFMFGLR